MAENEQEQGVGDIRTSAAGRLAAKRAAKAAAKAAARGTSALPDVVAANVDAVQTIYDRNARLLWVALGTVAVGAIAWFSISSYTNKQSRESAQLLSVAVDTAVAPIISGDETADEDGPNESYPSTAARAQKARAAYRTVVTRFSGAAAASWAMLGEANALRTLGKFADAERQYQVLAAKPGLEPFVQVRALEGLGFALEAQSKFAAAEGRFAEAAKLDNGSYKTVADYHRARMLAAQAEPKKAADLLESLIKAERARPSTEGGVVYESVVADAETMLAGLSVVLGTAKPHSDAAAIDPHAGGPVQGSGSGISKEIIEALRKQLANGKGGKGLTKEMIEKLEMQGGDSTTPSTHPTQQQPAAPAPKGAAQ